MRKYTTYRQRSAAKQASRRKRAIGKMIFTICFIIMLIFGIVNTASAKEEPAATKMVTCITVEYGDTLWNIAEDYFTSECGDMNSYIQEIKNCNQLFDDTICAGEKLIVPYYIVESHNN